MNGHLFKMKLLILGSYSVFYSMVYTFVWCTPDRQEIRSKDKVGKKKAYKTDCTVTITALL